VKRQGAPERGYVGMGIPWNSTGFSVGMGWVWGQKFHPHGSPVFYTSTDDCQHGTIRDAILRCAQKPTRVSLICRMETTTKKWKTEKAKN